MLTLWNGFDHAFDRELRRMTGLRASTAAPRPHDYGRHSYPRLGGWAEAQKPRLGGWAEAQKPRVNVLETEAALVVSAEVPGFAPDNVEVTLHEGVLVIEGKVDASENAEEGRVLFSERRNVSFKRTFTLNVDVNVEAITAVVKDGLLTVTLPTVEAAKPRQIAVAAAD